MIKMKDNDLESKINEEQKSIDKLKSMFPNSFSILPEKAEEYAIMKGTYDSLGDDYINQMRVMMGNITNPSADKSLKYEMIEYIPKALKILENKGKNVEYLRIAYRMALEHSGLPKYMVEK